MTGFVARKKGGCLPSSACGINTREDSGLDEGVTL
jgi:hypothetical protein